MKKKAITPVVSTALLLVFAVFAVIGFQGWFTAFESSVLSNNEQTANSFVDKPKIETIVGSTLYIINPSDSDSNLSQILVDGVECDVPTQLSSGTNKIDISVCLQNLDSNVPTISIGTKQGLSEKKIYLPSTNIPFCATDVNGFNNGTGTIINPFKICSCTQLQNIHNFDDIGFAEHYELSGNLDCSDTKNWNGGFGFKTINKFGGSLNGNSHTIYNFYSRYNSTLGTGNIFSTIPITGEYINKSIIKNLNFNNFDTSSPLLMAYTHSGTPGINISDISISGKLTNCVDVCGSLLGEISYLNINDISANVDLISSGTTGGIIGKTYRDAVVSDLLFTGSITHTTLAGEGVGGVIGFTDRGILATNIHSKSSIISTVPGPGVGGLIGSTRNEIILLNSSFEGSISATNSGFVSGLVAGIVSNSGILNNSYVIANISHNGSGFTSGILSGSSAVDVNNAYFIGNIIADDNVGGVYTGYGNPNLDSVYVVGDLTGASFVGGLTTRSSPINNSFYIGDIDANSSFASMIISHFPGQPTSFGGDFYWNNMSTNWDVITMNSSISGTHTAIQDNISYFQDQTKMPLSNFDTNFWTFPVNSYPKLSWEN
jgi:hypothetical protein